MVADRDNQDSPRPILQCLSCGGKYRTRSGRDSQALRCPHCGRSVRSGAPEPPGAEPARSPPGRRSTQAALVSATAELDPLEDLEVRRKPVPVPPLPLWSGVYSFPWQASGLRAWFLFGIDLSLIALLGGGLHYVIDLYRASGPVGIEGRLLFRVCIAYISAFVVFVLWTGTYAGGFFLATIEDTASGNPEVHWPDESIWEGFFRFLGLVWVFICAAFPLVIAATLLHPYLGSAAWWCSLLFSAIFIFPLAILSGLAHGSWFLLWNRDVLVNLLRRPLVLLTLSVMSGLLFCFCVGLGCLIIMDYGHFLFLAPLTGFVWSSYLLIYGRLLGRVAWVITGEHERAERRARRWKSSRRQRRASS